MGARELLGPADVTDGELEAMVCDLLGEDRVRLLDVRVEPVDYDLPAITTASRHWVSGHVATGSRVAPFRLFVKHVQSWQRHPYFQLVPVELRALAAAGVPWRTEPLVYRSDLRDRLPDGLTLPRALGVYDLDELSASLWLEEVPHRDVTWDLPRYRRAAFLLGRLAASSRVGELAGIGGFDWSVGQYVGGRLAAQVLPALHDDEAFSRPVAAAFTPGLRDRLRVAGDRAERYGRELDAMPRLSGHGDACPNNMLAGRGDDDFVLIDYGFWNPLTVGFDLGQLLVGDVQIGRRPAGCLDSVDTEIVPGYLEGLCAEGCGVDESVVRRAHALQLLLYSGLSALPVEHLAEEPTPALLHLGDERARLARYCLDLVDATGG
jgi:hypothetical protein